MLSLKTVLIYDQVFLFYDFALIYEEMRAVKKKSKWGCT